MIAFTSFFTSDPDDSVRMKLYRQFVGYVPKVLAPRIECTIGHILLPIPDNSPIFSEALAAFRENGAGALLFHDVYYTRRELSSIPYFEMLLSAPLELEGTASTEYGTKLIGGCQYCGLGAKTDGEVLIDRKFIKKTLIGNVIPDFIASEQIKSIIEGNELNGVLFKQNVRDWKGREMPNFYTMHMTPLPPLSELSWLKPDRHLHNACGHRITYIRSELRYEEDKLSSAKDFNTTKELLDNRQIPRLVVSAKVRQVFRDNNIRLFFRPVTVIPKGAPLPFKPDWLN